MKNYVQELLYEHNSVIIPSFGGFTASYKPASIDHVQGVIFPPSKDLKFNRYLTINDGMLVQYICDTKGWTRAEAETAVQDWVVELKSALERREMLEFPKVGRLYLDYEGNFRFLQDNTNYNRTSFGLPTVGFYPVTRNRQAPVEDAPQPRPAAAILELGGAEKSRSKIISGWFQHNVPYLAVASVLILVGTFFMMNSDKTSGKTALNSLVRPVSEERLNIKPQHEDDSDITTLYPEDMIDEAASEDEELAEEPKKQAYEPIIEEDIDTEGATPAPDAEEGIVIIGSFGNKKNVDKLVKKIYSKGYEPITEKIGKLTRVGVRFGYANLSEVTKKRREVASDFKVRAWIMQPEMPD